MLLKQFCVDILQTIDMLNAGNCSLKGFVCCKLHDIRDKLKKLHGTVQIEKVIEIVQRGIDFYLFEEISNGSETVILMK